MKILAPLRGVTIRMFRHVFAKPIVEAGFTEAITPFVSANAGVDPSKDRELKFDPDFPLKVTPQFIGKDPGALRFCLRRIIDMGYDTADLNVGCPFPMVRNKGRGSGLMKTPDILRGMLQAGCETMGDGRFSAKVRLGVDGPHELFELMPIFNEFPLRFVTVHARYAKQMYEGACDWREFEAVASLSKVPVVKNGDLPPDVAEGMVGRSFLRDLAIRPDITELLERYIKETKTELFGDKPVVGRLKELISYFAENPSWKRRWQTVKLARSLDELAAVLCLSDVGRPHV